MKKMKKFLSVLLASAMTLAMAAPSFAATPAENQSGTITISPATEGQTYNIYKIFDLESYNTNKSDPNKSIYSYRVVDVWENFIKGVDDGEGNITGGYLDYFTLDKDGYLTNSEKMNAATAEAFAKAALDYAVENGIDKSGSESAVVDQTEDVTNEDGSVTKVPKTYKVEFKNLELGYYLVDSSAGVLCALDTTDPNMVIREKNEVPTVEKEFVDIKDETVSIGDVVGYNVTIHAKDGAQKYEMHDKMSAGLTFNENVIITMNNKVTLAETVYDVVLGTATDDFTFKVVFTDDFCAGLGDGDTLVINYSATVNEYAIAGTDPITNEAVLKYGDNAGASSTPSKVESKTYMFGLMKTDTSNVLLPGATFRLYENNKGVYEEIAVVSNGTDAYRKAKAGETGDVITAGNITVDGLRNGIYYVKEVTAPAGYNLLPDYVAVEIKDADNTVNTTTDNSGKTLYDINNKSGLQVINNTGAELPSTGGIGTTIFYAAGIILMAGAVFFVVRRKRA